MPDNENPLPLTPGAEVLAAKALAIQALYHHETLCLHHWLCALLERHGPMAADLVKGFDHPAELDTLRGRLQANEPGAPLAQATLFELASQKAQAESKPRASERDLAAAILETAGYELAAEPDEVVFRQPASSASGGFPPPSGGEAATTRALDQFGIDFTRLAREGHSRPVIGRETETQLVIETLLRQTKRNPVLIGPAGVGKTAIVEGLAQRIAAEQVPEALRGARVIGIQPSNLVAGAGIVGELQNRFKALLAEASQEGIILFIDEVHSIIGAGGMPGTSDLASLLKPTLARGELACIAATTDEEYRRFIEPDSALERRFQPIRVHELTADQTTQILVSLQETVASSRKIQVSEEVLRWLVDFAQQFLKNRYFPDKAVDLFEQCVVYAEVQKKNELKLQDVETVVQRMIGMPPNMVGNLQALKERLAQQAILPEGDTETLLNRLEVTFRGYDMRPARPNAIVLLAGQAASIAGPLATLLSETLFASPERIVRLDFSRFVERHDLSMLIGSPPGYIGYSDTLAIHQIAQMPWCVLVCENIHLAHPQVREVLIQSLATGLITDARGKRIFLSDVIVVLTAGLTPAETRSSLGFFSPPQKPGPDALNALKAVLGGDFLAHIDLVITEISNTKDTRRRWLEENLLARVFDRYAIRGITLHWDESLIEWLLTQEKYLSNQREWEKLVDEKITPQLISFLEHASSSNPRSLRVVYSSGNIEIQPL